MGSQEAQSRSFIICEWNQTCVSAPPRLQCQKVFLKGVFFFFVSSFFFFELNGDAIFTGFQECEEGKKEKEPTLMLCQL